jgi:hypothetical protein
MPRLRTPRVNKGKETRAGSLRELPALSFDSCIEDDGVLFFTRKLSISAKSGYFLGLASGKIGMRGDILET